MFPTLCMMFAVATPMAGSEGDKAISVLMLILTFFKILIGLDA